MWSSVPDFKILILPSVRDLKYSCGPVYEIIKICGPVYEISKYSCGPVYKISKYSRGPVYEILKYSCGPVYEITKYSCGPVCKTFGTYCISEQRRLGVSVHMLRPPRAIAARMHKVGL